MGAGREEELGEAPRDAEVGRRWAPLLLLLLCWLTFLAITWVTWGLGGLDLLNPVLENRLGMTRF